MFVNLNLEEDELDVLEYCVDTVLTKWETDYQKECESKEIQKNPIALETLEYKRDWINNMKSILHKIEPLKEIIENQYGNKEIQMQG